MRAGIVFITISTALRTPYCCCCCCCQSLTSLLCCRLGKPDKVLAFFGHGFPSLSVLLRTCINTTNNRAGVESMRRTPGARTSAKDILLGHSCRGRTGAKRNLPSKVNHRRNHVQQRQQAQPVPHAALAIAPLQISSVSLRPYAHGEIYRRWEAVPPAGLFLSCSRWIFPYIFSRSLQHEYLLSVTKSVGSWIGRYERNCLRRMFLVFF